MQNVFGKSFTLAAYMLGIALGHNKTYSCLYENMPLPIYKSKEEMAAILLRKKEEKERAIREMERLEREREYAREKNVLNVDAIKVVNLLSQQNPMGKSSDLLLIRVLKMYLVRIALHAVRKQVWWLSKEW